MGRIERVEFEGEEFRGVKMWRRVMLM